MKRATMTAVAAATLGMTCFGAASAPALAQLPKKAAPQGMVEGSGGGSGRILTSHMGGTTSARKMLMALKMVSGEYFDKPFVVTRAFADKRDQNLQAAFIAQLGGVPVHGVASVRMDGGESGGQGTLLFDDAKTFAQSFHGLTARQKGGGASAPDNTPLIPQTAPDGSSQISLPTGFQITGAYKGTLDIAGPNGTAMAMGTVTACTRPDLATSYTGFVPVDFSDPRRALVDYLNYMGRKSGVPVAVRILDARPVSGGVGRAAYIRYTAQAAGKSVEVFGLFSISAIDATQAILYQSFIAAPTATYRTEFPKMLRAWGTWSINPGVFTERLMAAAQSMRGMSDVITSGDNNRQQSQARVSEAWSDLMRDQGTWSNPGTGARHKVSNVLTNGGGIPMVGGTPLQPVPLSDL